MLTDLDLLQHNLSIDAIVVPLHESMHPAFRWLTRGAKVTRGYAIKIAGREPVLVCYDMERDEAAATGLQIRSIHDYDYDRIFRSAVSASDAYAQFFDAVLRDHGAQTTVAFYGNLPVHLYLGIADALTTRGWIVHRGGDDLLQLARKRKDPWEIDAIASVGQRTVEVVGCVRAALREWHESMTLGDLKQIVTTEITRRGMIEDHETILSQGRDAGVPHSRGNAAARVEPSVPIVLDIFPADRTSGYFFDMTRTFCVGPIPDELQQIHADVFAAFELARDAMRPGTRAASYQAMVCDFFESKGYDTSRRNPRTLSGYVHGLGHGVGLEIHEKPSFGLTPSNKELIETGDIVTIEPGLYFPDRAIGVRIEDTFVVREDGVESLCGGGYGLEA
jgi:Xaa-Pro aminopeptidase